MQKELSYVFIKELLQPTEVAQNISRFVFIRYNIEDYLCSLDICYPGLNVIVCDVGSFTLLIFSYYIWSLCLSVKATY